jgi:hypothetical protein
VQQPAFKSENLDAGGQHIIEIGTIGIVHQPGVVAGILTAVYARRLIDRASGLSR